MWPGIGSKEPGGGPLRRKKRELGRRILRLGTRGKDVSELQKKLQQLGYHVGEVDGVYGYLTWEAVRQLQKDYRLRVDGVAGKEVYQFLGEESPHRLAEVYVVQKGENLVDVARHFEVTREALLASTRLSRRQITPGTRVVLHSKLIFGQCFPSEEDAARQSLLQHSNQITGLIFSAHSVTAKGSLHGDIPRNLLQLCGHYNVLPIASIYNDGQEFPDPTPLLRSRRATEELAKEVTGLLKSGYRGINIAIDGILPGTGKRFIRLLRKLKAVLEKRHLPLYLTLNSQRRPTGLARLWDDFDREQMGQLASYVILKEPYPPENPGPLASLAGLESVLTRFRRHIPMWKVLLGVPVYGLDWPADGKAEGNLPQQLSYDEARTLAYHKQVKMQWDETARVPFYSYPEGEKTHLVYLENRSSLAAKCDLVHRFNCAGLVLFGLGLEDRRIWEVILEKFKVAHPKGKLPES